MSAYRVTMFLALAAVGCQRGGASTSTESSTETAIPATTAATVSTAITPSSAESGGVPVPPPPAEECTPGLQIAPPTLAASWPGRIGSRVRFKGHVDASVDVMTAVVMASGHRFAVVAGPDQLWQGDRERTYTVMGSKTLAIGGRTTLPQLLLEPECSP